MSLEKPTHYRIAMDLNALASEALQQMTGLTWPDAFLRGDLNGTVTNLDQQHPQLASDLSLSQQPTDELGEEDTTDAMAEDHAMNTVVENEESHINNTHSPTTDRSRQARLARARARAKKAARKGKKRVMNYWSREEEEALWTALSEVGPKWSLIANLHGKNGTASKALKDRDPTSMRAKAIYVKYMLLESGEHVPAYLEQVPVKVSADYSRTRRDIADGGSDE